MCNVFPRIIRSVVTFKVLKHLYVEKECAFHVFLYGTHMCVEKESAFHMSEFLLQNIVSFIGLFGISFISFGIRMYVC